MFLLSVYIFYTLDFDDDFSRKYMFVRFKNLKEVTEKIEKSLGHSENRTRDLSHPKRQLYH